jgi:hypothetical protein
VLTVVAHLRCGRSADGGKSKFCKKSHASSTCHRHFALTPSHLHTFTPSHLHTSTPSHQHLPTICHLHGLTTAQHFGILRKRFAHLKLDPRVFTTPHYETLPHVRLHLRLAECVPLPIPREKKSLPCETNQARSKFHYCYQHHTTPLSRQRNIASRTINLRWTHANRSRSADQSANRWLVDHQLPQLAHQPLQHFALTLCRSSRQTHRQRFCVTSRPLATAAQTRLSQDSRGCEHLLASQLRTRSRSGLSKLITFANRSTPLWTKRSQSL